MSRLSKDQRAGLSRSQFALSGRRFPVENAAHQRAAIMDVPKAVRAGSISPTQARHVVDEARADLARRSKTAPKVAPRRSGH